jgi:hypothetical protein
MRLVVEDTRRLVEYEDVEDHDEGDGDATEQRRRAPPQASGK